MKGFASCLFTVMICILIPLIIFCTFFFVSYNKSHNKKVTWEEIGPPMISYSDDKDKNEISLIFNVDSDNSSNYHRLSEADQVKYAVYWIDILPTYTKVKVTDTKIVFTYDNDYILTVKYNSVRGGHFHPISK